ncbi:MAG: phage tail tape measure protein, partial [Thaumarchaeota archaeon]
MRAQEQISRAVKKATNAMRRIEGVTGRLQKEFKRFGDIMKGVFMGMISYDIFYRVTEGIQEAINAYMEFEAESVKLAAMSANLGQNIQLLASLFRVEASSAARELGVSSLEAMHALESLVKAGLEGGEAAKALGAAIRMARLEGVDFATAANRLVQVMSQFGISGAEASRVVDALVNASRLGIGTANDFAQGLANCGASARALGLGLEEALGWLIILERRFGSAQEAGTHLNRVFMELPEVAEKLGVSIKDANGNFRDANEVLKDVINRVRELGGDLRALEGVLTGVNMRTVRGLFMLSQAEEDVEGLTQMVKRMGTAWQAYNEWLNTAQGRTALVNAEIERLSLNAGKNLADLKSAILMPVMALGELHTGIYRMTFSLGDVAQALHGFLDVMLSLRLMSREAAADMIASWVEAGYILPQQAADIAEAIGVSSDKLSTVLTDAATNISRFLDDMYKKGQLTKEMFLGTVEAAIVSGQVSAEQAIEWAEKYGYATDDVIEHLKRLDQQVHETDETLQKLKEQIEDVSLEIEHLSNVQKIYENMASRFNVQVTLTNALLGEKAEKIDAVKAAIEEWKRSQERLNAVTQIFNYLTSQTKLTLMILELQERGLNAEAQMLSDTMTKLNAAMADGIFTEQELIDTISELCRKYPQLRSLMAPVLELYYRWRYAEEDVAEASDEKTKKLKEQGEAIDETKQKIEELQNVMDWWSTLESGINYLTSQGNAVLSARKALYWEEIDAVKQLNEMLKEGEALKKEDLQTAFEWIDTLKQEGIITDELATRLKDFAEHGARTKEAKEALKQTLEALNRSMEKYVGLTKEEEATLARLNAIGQQLNLVQQGMQLQMQALQLEMLGNKEAADKLREAYEKIQKALEDGYMSADEFKDIMETISETPFELTFDLSPLETAFTDLATNVTQKFTDLTTNVATQVTEQLTPKIQEAAQTVQA